MKSSSVANLAWIHHTTKPQEGKQTKDSSGNQGSCIDWDTVWTEEVGCKVMPMGYPRLMDPGLREVRLFIDPTHRDTGPTDNLLSWIRNCSDIRQG